MKILLGDCDEKVRRGNIFKPTIRNESLHQGSSDNDVSSAGGFWYERRKVCWSDLRTLC